MLPPLTFEPKSGIFEDFESSILQFLLFFVEALSDEELLTDGEEEQQLQVQQRRLRHEDVEVFNKSCVFSPVFTPWPCVKSFFVSSRARPNTKSVLNSAWSTPQVRCMFSQKFAKPAVGRPKMALSRTS